VGDDRIVIAQRTADASLRGLLALLAQKLVDEPVLGTDSRKSISSGPKNSFSSVGRCHSAAIGECKWALS
jgi:hypothetical protein